MEEQAKIEYQAGRLTASVALLMPEIGGAELATEIQSDPVLQHVRIVFLTAIVSSKETGGQYLESAGQTFVAKPVNLDALIQCIEDNTVEL